MKKRVLLASQSGLSNFIAEASSYEFQGLISQIDDVDVVTPTVAPADTGGPIDTLKQALRDKVVDVIDSKLRTTISFALALTKRSSLRNTICFSRPFLAPMTSTFCNTSRVGRNVREMSILWIEEFWLHG